MASNGDKETPFYAPTEQGRHQYAETPEGNDLQAPIETLRRQLEAMNAEVQRLCEENTHLRQQLAAMEKTSREGLDTVHTLSAQYRASEALRSDQITLVKTQEQQLAVLMARLQVVQQALDMVQHTRTYRFLRRLGRWKFMGQTPLQAPDSSSPVAQPANAALAGPSFDDPGHLARLLGERYAGDQTLFSLWEAHGFHLTPVHFYSPIPQVSALSEKIWTCPTELVGIELNESVQLAFLEQICMRFKAEYDAFPHNLTRVPYEYHFNQPMFRSVDAEVLYCMIRHYGARQIVEVGSGFSTYLAAAAARKNAAEGRPTQLVAIDPYANELLRQGFPGLGQLLPQPVQHVALDVFTALSANDILFIDSSHVLRLDSDVRFLLLEVLPRLQPGVLVHFHDIFLPHHYPREWVVKEHRFWTEQYLLQAFMAFNNAFEVLWAGSYMHLHHSDKLQRAFASYESTTVWPGSFWMRRLRA